MTEREAIERALELLPQMRDSQWVTALGQVTAIYTDEAKEAFNIAIAALEKQEKKPAKAKFNKRYNKFVYFCPVCGEVTGYYDYCSDCGQAIDYDNHEPYTEEEA